MCVCMHACMCVYVHVCACMCVHARMRTHTIYLWSKVGGSSSNRYRRPLLVLPSPSPSPSPSHYTLNYNYTRVQREERGKSFAPPPPPSSLFGSGLHPGLLTHPHFPLYLLTLPLYLPTSLCTHSPPSVPTHLPLYPLTSLCTYSPPSVPTHLPLHPLTHHSPFSVPPSVYPLNPHALCPSSLPTHPLKSTASVILTIIILCIQQWRNLPFPPKPLFTSLPLGILFQPSPRTSF